MQMISCKKKKSPDILAKIKETEKLIVKWKDLARAESCRQVIPLGWIQTPESTGMGGLLRVIAFLTPFSPCQLLCTSLLTAMCCLDILVLFFFPRLNVILPPTEANNRKSFKSIIYTLQIIIFHLLKSVHCFLPSHHNLIFHLLGPLCAVLFL